MNKAQIKGMRMMAETLHPQAVKRWKIVDEKGQVKMFDLEEGQADDMRENFFPFCNVIEM